jgi:hypothetical protein
MTTLALVSATFFFSTASAIAQLLVDRPLWSGASLAQAQNIMAWVACLSAPVGIAAGCTVAKIMHRASDY